jgi:asparagine synthetase B (glutamine-hydrolysing)
MCTFKITNCPTPLDIDSFLPMGGPDAINTIERDGIFFTHSLLHITGTKTVQPVVKSEKIYMLLGEIYNYGPKFKSEMTYIIKMYETYGSAFTEKLDGEYLIVVYEDGIINFFTDPWSTRQAWYETIDNYFYFGTFPLDEKNVTATRLRNNSHYTFDTKTNALTLEDGELHKWDLNQYKTDLTDWTAAFEKAVVKRWCNDMVLSLSGGLDSIAIALCLADYKLSYNSINLCLYDCEDMVTYGTTLLYTKSYNKAYMIKGYEQDDSIQFKRLKDAGISHNGSRRIVKKIQEMGLRVNLAGHGADEIMTNYMNKDTVIPHSEFTVWPEDLSEIFPYSHFYALRESCDLRSAYKRNILDKHELISLTYGVELRNVFLDIDLVQEWLWLLPELKNKDIKYPLVKYLQDRNIKLPSNVVSFNRQNDFKDV